MSVKEKPLLPDGRIRIPIVLTKEQVEAVREVKIDGLNMLNLNVVDFFTVPETWIEYWFDRNMISEDVIRFQIQKAINSSQ